MPGLRAVPQTSIYETTLDNAELEQALETREKLKARAGAVRKQYADADEVAKAFIKTLELGDGAVVRVGRFVIADKPVAARSVAFETEPTRRISIKLIKDAIF
jgi:hypothetical protein